ncbi:MAG: type II toxin-antitoxin system prevent-host-death family antitoxin [Oscillatoriales cyanobacterium RU_3_3]|nr:type II toxin-antitoxin system prevent-host-death family antitoxin [Microcoleus sp. SU_5_6]NJL67439.1 type II toxin-antitoxin system prevent-host-death family antitoxin [Microcoleus sp. SM1_3_4]NJM60413.1 type II toxin-antitoxin system prevent-host-death family antitoxin [Oscillatoriales cyanobacterium RU_3_3]NJS42192.1 type II toxin-antitoxin system prevent-host-death family antitoxin [Candidatus Gracilibacteria bacterium]
MKQLSLEQLSEQLQDYVRSAQKEQILITQNGKPIALLLGLENFDSEQWNLQFSVEFWETIADRRQRPTVPLSVVEAQLEELDTD